MSRFERSHSFPAPPLRALSLSIITFATASVFAASSASATNFILETVTPERATDTSLRLDALGTPHISYNLGHPFYDLKYAVKSGGIWTTEMVDSTGLFGSGSSLALDAAGNPHISYAPNGAWYASKASGSWVTEQIDASAASATTSLALDAAGNPHVAYSGPGGLMYASKIGTTWTIETVDAAAWGPSLVLDASGTPHIGYALSSGPLRYAVKKMGAWSVATVESLDTGGGAGFFDPPALRLDSQGGPHMSYMANFPDYNQKYAERVQGTWVTAVVDSTGLVGWYNSLDLDAQDRPRISYSGAGSDLKYATNDGSGWVIETVDPTSGVGDYNSLFLSAQGPHISYWDFPNNRVRYAYLNPATDAPALTASPHELSLATPLPNPQVGPGATTFRFTLPGPETVYLTVHDVVGRTVASWAPREYPAGSHTVLWNPGTAAAGVYFVRLTTGSGQLASARWVLLR